MMGFRNPIVDVSATVTGDVTVANEVSVIGTVIARDDVVKILQFTLTPGQNTSGFDVTPYSSLILTCEVVGGSGLFTDTINLAFGNTATVFSGSMTHLEKRTVICAPGQTGNVLVAVTRPMDGFAAVQALSASSGASYKVTLYGSYRDRDPLTWTSGKMGTPFIASNNDGGVSKVSVSVAAAAITKQYALQTRTGPAHIAVSINDALAVGAGQKLRFRLVHVNGNETIYQTILTTAGEIITIATTNVIFGQGPYSMEIGPVAGNTGTVTGVVAISQDPSPLYPYPSW